MSRPVQAQCRHSRCRGRGRHRRGTGVGDMSSPVHASNTSRWSRSASLAVASRSVAGPAAAMRQGWG
eukprot:scaffold70263_cov63-Phaeocystis_antarctica.AAC.1